MVPLSSRGLYPLLEKHNDTEGNAEAETQRFQGKKNDQAGWLLLRVITCCAHKHPHWL